MSALDANNVIIFFSFPKQHFCWSLYYSKALKAKCYYSGCVRSLLLPCIDRFMTIELGYPKT